MLINRTWQAVPEMEGAEIYPCLRKPDVLSSNAYLIRTEGQMILIDPGALEEQSEVLIEAIAGCGAFPRPLLILLTHCHIDHSREALVFRSLAREAPVWIAACGGGCEALAAGDERLTAAELYGVSFPAFMPDIRFLTPEDQATMAPRSHPLSGGTLQIKTENLNPAGLGRPFYKQVVTLGDVTLELFHAPGHSPDSVCIGIGGLLFIGDLLAAVNPMVAGITGWEREDFIATLDHLTRILTGTPSLLCCPGHGGVMTAGQTLEAFRKIRLEDASLGDSEDMNPERLHFTTEYALDLIGEAEEVFSAVAGRLYYLSYWLEELDEGEEAARCRVLADMGAIDACLTDFRSLAEELRQGKRIELEFALRSLAIIQKIRRLFNRGALEKILPKPLLNRTMRLMMDFIQVTKGIRSGGEVIPVDLNELVGAILDEFRKDPHADEAIMDKVDDAEAFLAALASRIASAPSWEGVGVSLEGRRDLPLVRLDPARFGDVLADLIGHLAVGGARAISLATQMDDDGVLLRIVPRDGLFTALLSEEKERLFARRFAMCRVGLKNEGSCLALFLPA